MKRIAIIAGGTLSESVIADIRKNSHFVGVDRGAHWLLKHSIIPDIAIGDFDSVSQEERKEIQEKSKSFVPYPAEKNWTDLELAINYAIKQNPESIDIFGGFGTRLDHSLAAVQLLEVLAHKHIPASLLDEHNRLSILREKTVLSQSTKYHYISLFPLTQIVVVSLYGFKYNGSQIRLTKGMTRGLSNELIEHDGIIDVHQGIALLIQSRDA